MQPSQGWRVEPLESEVPGLGPVFGAVLSVCVCGWLLWVLCPDGCRQVEESKKGGLRGSRRWGGGVAVAGSRVNGRA